MNNIIVYWSGGKDSTANILKMIELGFRNFNVVCINTGLEWDYMYVYWEKCKKFFSKYGIKVHTYKSKYTWEEVFYKVKQKGNKKGQIYGFPYSVGAWCNARLKEEPTSRANNDFKGYINYIGYAIDEKSKLRQLKIQNKLKGINKFTTKSQKGNVIECDITNERYLLAEHNMTEKDCLELTKKYGLYNELYNYFDRTGCWCCPKQPLKSLKNIYLYFPKQWQQLRIWQKDSPTKFKPNYSIFELEEKFCLNASQEEQKILRGNGIPPTSKEVGILPKII